MDTLTIRDAGYLADLIRGVERGARLRYYARGADDAEHPMTVVLRAFTREDGALYPRDADIRDAHVWTSGMMEHWFGVRDLISAIINAVDCTNLSGPMAIIEE